MELFYRGIAHQTNEPTVETIETAHQGRFLGRVYTIQQGKVAYRQSSKQLKYRGIDYNA